LIDVLTVVEGLPESHHFVSLFPHKVLTLLSVFVLLSTIFTAFLFSALVLFSLIMVPHIVSHEDISVTPVAKERHDTFVIIAIEHLAETTVR
jgi:hypothetical protein